jgi:hypothetical protein
VYKINETEKFKKQIANLTPDYPRIHDALDGVRWALEREPHLDNECFPSFGGHAFRLYPFPGVPKAIVYYTIIDDIVELYAIYDTSPSDTIAL